MDFTVDATDLLKTLKRFQDKAIPEIKHAVKNTAIYGHRDINDHTPTKTHKAHWYFPKYNGMNATITSMFNYVAPLDAGWNRTKPILPKGNYPLVFQVGKFTAAKSSTATLKKRYRAAMSSLKGKGLSQLEKAKLATQKTGVVITMKVETPASFRGYNFIIPSVNRMSDRLQHELSLSIDRLLA